ncbi:hypothetical protein B0I35DRAFT_474113 [Stachybotrys elegans]|uniref:LrgB-like protein n=1 Tax=Stachybotrys elegans TaxID=80388 RepID=A0A8K0WYH4_9HYPO|nr:hypothetical protein B0I35DRAFT_474113 [Stachybotrys elegans]
MGLFLRSSALSRVIGYTANIACAFLLYLLSQLIIWGLSLALRAMGFEYFATLLGMLVIFVLMSVAHAINPLIDTLYAIWLKDRIGFINVHLGVGFPIPLATLDRNEMLGSHEIVRVIANFAVTNAIFWPAVFLSTMLLLAVLGHAVFWFSASKTKAEAPLDTHGSLDILHSIHGIDQEKTSEIPDWNDRLSVRPQLSMPQLSMMSMSDAERALVSQSESQGSESGGSPASTRGCGNTSIAREILAICISVFCAMGIGVPVAAFTGDERILDACMLWFIWITAVKLQRMFKASHFMSSSKQTKQLMATFMNPVLLTSLGLVGYIRTKAAIHPVASLHAVIHSFRGGTPLHELWTAGVMGDEVTANPAGWFGAGDLALSLLEVGILLWGFKLHECRAQLFGLAGVVNILVSVMWALVQAFVSTICARAIGLDPPEALAFAARSTTLALSKPAMQSIGGNTAVNAAIVVSNGILGQIGYPFLLDRLGVKREYTEQELAERARAANTTTEGRSTAGTAKKKCRAVNNAKSIWERNGDDSMVTIAAGIAIGMNGLAMGVAYLYETRSRAAPHAALSMTVFSAMTVVFTTVEPFRGILLSLAGG